MSPALADNDQENDAIRCSKLESAPGAAASLLSSAMPELPAHYKPRAVRTGQFLKSLIGHARSQNVVPCGQLQEILMEVVIPCSPLMPFLAWPSNGHSWRGVPHNCHDGGRHWRLLNALFKKRDASDEIVKCNVKLRIPQHHYPKPDV